jgi:hypothetical protein
VPYQRPILPIANAGITSSTGGILETSQSRQTEINSRSVRFSPEVTGQDRTLTGYELDMEAGTEKVSAPDVRPELLYRAAHSVNPISQPHLSEVNSSAERRHSLDLNMSSVDQPAVRELESDGQLHAVQRHLPS